MPNITTKNWMSNLTGSITIDQLSIPGTHDSGTSKVTGPFKGAALTQNFDITRQLNDGIRFLDIRVKHTDISIEPLQIFHGVIGCNISFGDVLNDCIKFLKENHHETIIMLINAASDEDKDIQNSFDYYLEQQPYKDLFYLEPKLPTLAGLRGKIVLFRRFQGYGGVDLSSGWEVNSTFTLVTPDGVEFKIEDQYKEDDTTVKLKAVTDNIESAINKSSDGVIYITYNSISQGLHTPYQYACGGGLTPVNPKMNTGMESYLTKNLGAKKFGVIMLDFYNNKEGSISNNSIKLIINSNPGVELSP
ncbi:MAG: phosphatidylinositol-specific phospholipase C [Alteromonadaceae bacterium]|nr:phosphatidylinositol-specific phospholipase C [Alteromonadaceae bacterium]